MKAAKAGHQEVINLMLQGQCQVNLPDKVSLKSTIYMYSSGQKKIPVALTYNGRWTPVPLPFALRASNVHFTVGMVCVYTYRCVAHKRN